MPTTLTLTALDTTPLAITVPTRWPDVSFATFVDYLAPAPDEQRLPAEILCGLDAGTLGALALTDAEYLLNLLAFSLDASDVLALPATPGLPDVGSLSYGAMLEVHQHLESQPDRPPLASMAYILAVYRCELLWGKYNEAKVSAAHTALLEAPCTEVYPDASHFMSSWRNWQKGTNPTPKTAPSSTTKKSTPVPKSWASGLARCFTWMRRRAVPS
ncbi:hypothetical protein [Hymenobacter negativus]|uniref:Uncharacterized protein n=1 Tax=Hymenobacter negativus TaxID=2795026 RepID=A0ABS3QI09_9BACT|nr:hypothetical protein [Hymenobacter negativus]MBO2010880.1 hypothetical protein [Hymenobacter negativus]